VTTVERDVFAHLETTTSSGEGGESGSSVDDDEIEQLYDYVRGLAPLPSTCVEKSTRRRRPPAVPQSISPTDTNQSSSHHSSTSPPQRERFLSPVMRAHSKVFEMNQPRVSRRPRPISVSHEHHRNMEQALQQQQQQAYGYPVEHAPAHSRIYASQHNVANVAGSMRSRQAPRFMPLLRNYLPAHQRMSYHMSHLNLSAPQQHRYNGAFVPQLAPFS